MFAARQGNGCMQSPSSLSRGKQADPQCRPSASPIPRLARRSRNCNWGLHRSEASEERMGGDGDVQYLVQVDGTGLVKPRASVRHGDPWRNCERSEKTARARGEGGTKKNRLDAKRHQHNCRRLCAHRGKRLGFRDRAAGGHDNCAVAL